jgi:hypothetical protein
MLFAHRSISAAPVLFRFRTHPQIIYVARYYTQKLCSRYERVRAARDLFRAISGQREKIAHLSHGHITSDTDATRKKTNPQCGVTRPLRCD